MEAIVAYLHKVAAEAHENPAQLVAVGVVLIGGWLVGVFVTLRTIIQGLLGGLSF